MDKISLAVEILENSTERLLKRHLELKRENAELKKSLEEMSKSISEKEKTISGLIEKNRSLTVVRAVQPDDKKVIQKTINEMIREVDKCIAQLNK